MSLRIIRSPQAREDLIESYVFIGRNNPRAAERFLDAAEETFRKLLDMPGLGTPCEHLNPKLTGLRSWRIRGFENWLVFYRPLKEGIEVVRVLHGARELEGLLEEEAE